MRDNYVAKNANKFNRGGAHPDRSKYSRSTGLSKHGALDELDDDVSLEQELEADAAFAACDSDYTSLCVDSEYLKSNQTDKSREEEMDCIFNEPLHYEDYE